MLALDTNIICRYQVRLTKLIENLRADLAGGEEVPFILGEPRTRARSHTLTPVASRFSSSLALSLYIYIIYIPSFPPSLSPHPNFSLWRAACVCAPGRALACHQVRWDTSWWKTVDTCLLANMCNKCAPLLPPLLQRRRGAPWLSRTGWGTKGTRSTSTVRPHCNAHKHLHKRNNNNSGGERAGGGLMPYVNAATRL